MYLPCTDATGLQPDFDAVSEDTWIRTQLLFICTPGNPTGATLSKAQLKALIQLADKYDFVIASDECYSEIYRDKPHRRVFWKPVRNWAGTITAAAWSSTPCPSVPTCPGCALASWPATAKSSSASCATARYHGCAMPIHHQLASICCLER